MFVVVLSSLSRRFKKSNFPLIVWTMNADVYLPQESYTRTYTQAHTLSRFYICTQNMFYIIKVHVSKTLNDTFAGMCA